MTIRADLYSDGMSYSRERYKGFRVAGEAYRTPDYTGPKIDMRVSLPSVFSTVCCILYLRQWSISRISQQFHLPASKIQERITTWLERVRPYAKV